ncbi:Salicylic acid-binding protein 2 [Acorus calamus]|uniref:Salicylic acid-binding protein 2 n=1 Tax=Acorus calamus TaxID=4465 RepID=A0AAV9DIH2_ACOCL|nr:Salicylic acid-binding protein 2 [Acorus calamus]
MGDSKQPNHHFVLVHGLGHGAWCWYKLTTLLRSAGHRATTIDLSASGIHPTIFHDIRNFDEYAKPLIDFLVSLPHDDRVILVGHSFGGLSLALAMERFPNKISLAVFLSAFMPDTASPPAHVINEYFERNLIKSWMDTKFTYDGGPDKPPTTMLFGPEILINNLYQNCPMEDYTLAITLVRVGSLFQDELTNLPAFSTGRYGSVDRAFVICGEDKIIPRDYQIWMSENNAVEVVKEIEGADHMAMLSKPKELFELLMEIAH